MPQITQRAISQRFSPAGFEPPTFRDGAQVASAAAKSLARHGHPTPLAVLSPQALRREIQRLATRNRELGGNFSVPCLTGLTQSQLRPIAVQLDDANRSLMEPRP